MAVLVGGEARTCVAEGAAHDVEPHAVSERDLGVAMAGAVESDRRDGGVLGLTYRQYLALAGELEPDTELTDRIVDLCGWPRRSCATSASPTPP